MKGILVAGIESPLALALCAEAGKRAEHFARALIPVPFGTPPAGNRTGLETARPGAETETLEWNPGSPISTRSLVLGAENRLERLDLAVLVCTPPPLRRLPEELSPADIEIAVSDCIKGWFFLIREISASFTARRDTVNIPALAMVLTERGAEKGDIPDLAGAPVTAAFRALAQGVLSSQSSHPWHSFAFSSDLAEDREFAAFIFRVLEEESGKRGAGKWHRYGRFPLFSK